MTVKPKPIPVPPSAAVACPHCQAPAGQLCRRSELALRSRGSHQARIDAYLKLPAVQRSIR